MQQVLGQLDQVKQFQQGKNIMAKDSMKQNAGHVAVARALNLPVSTKHCIEICRNLRFKDVSYAKKYLEEVSVLRRAVPYKRFIQDLGHKAGMSAGRYPQKAAKEILRLLRSVEANAQAKGLDTANLKITKFLANKASIPFTGARHRTGTKRTHVEVEVRERFAKKAGKEEVKSQPVKATKKEEAPAMPEPVPAAKETPKPVSEMKQAKAVKEEPSSAELLHRAQQKAAELKLREKEQKETQDVTNLYEELQKKGSLRSKGGRP